MIHFSSIARSGFTRPGSIALAMLGAFVAGRADAQTAIDQQNPASAWSCLNSGFFTQSQTFSPDFDRMNFTDIYLDPGKGSAVDGDFSLRISRNGVLVEESDRLAIPAVIGSGGKYHRFTFDRDVNFARNAEYEIELVNHSNTSYFAWCQSQNDAYPGGAPLTDPPGGDPAADYLFRTGMQSIYTPLQPAPVGGDYVYYESAPAPTTPITSGLQVTDNFFSGLNFTIERPTRISRLGASFGSGSQTIFAALFSASGFIDPPDSVDLTSDDVLATTLVNIPPRDFNGPPVEAYGEVDVVLQPGEYGVVFGSGLFGATGDSSLAAVDEAYRSQIPYSFRTFDGARFTQASDVRVVIEGDSLPGVHQARAAYDAEVQLYNGTWVVIDGEQSTRADLFPFYDIDARGLMEFPIDEIPTGATVTAARLEMEPDQISGNAQGDSAEWVLHGFAGDGVLDEASAASPLNEIGRSDPIASFDPVTIDLDVAYLQSLIDQGATHLGLMVRGGSNGLSANYLNWESGSPHQIPLLSIEFSVPELLPGDYNFDGVVDAADYAVWRESLGQTGVSLAADGDLSGVVDSGDFAIWRDNFGASAPATGETNAATPEPSSICLVALMMVVLAPGLRRPAP